MKLFDPFSCGGSVDRKRFIGEDIKSDSEQDRVRADRTDNRRHGADAGEPSAGLVIVL